MFLLRRIINEAVKKTVKESNDNYDMFDDKLKIKFSGYGVYIDCAIDLDEVEDNSIFWSFLGLAEHLDRLKVLREKEESKQQEGFE